MNRTTVKEGPLVFIRNVLIMEVAAAIFMYAISFLENYEQLYTSLGFKRFLRYNNFLELAFSLFQMFYILLLFLDWYFSHYEINDKEIVRKSGLLFRRRKSADFSYIVSIEVYQSPLSRMMHHATLILEHEGGRLTKLKNVGNFEEHLNTIKQYIRSSSGSRPIHDVNFLIEQSEGPFVEFKETLRYDLRRNEVSKDVERAAMKTIVGFLNAAGGILLIGVGDGGEISGLSKDYQTLVKKNRDGFENHLNMLVRGAIGIAFAKYINVDFEKVEDKDVCIVVVKESYKPAYLRNGDKTEEFFVRVGNSTQPFSMSEAGEYIKTHWK